MMEDGSKIVPSHAQQDAQDAGTESAQAGWSGGGLKEDLQYLIQSALGKYSLETYLEVLGGFTDGEIRDRVRDGLIYRGGEASFTARRGEWEVIVSVALHFQDQEGEWSQVKAERSLRRSMFTGETLRRLEDAESVSFAVHAPEGG